jgi:hypothetical protein
MYQNRNHAFRIVILDLIQHGLKCDDLLLILVVCSILTMQRIANLNNETCFIFNYDSTINAVFILIILVTVYS